MNKVAIAFFTKDKTELTKRSIEPLLQLDKFDLWWFDGSDTPKGQEFPDRYRSDERMRTIYNVRGGPDRAVVYALTRLLKHEHSRTGEIYEYIGLCENDVLLHPDWFGPTMALFERGA